VVRHAVIATALLCAALPAAGGKGAAPYELAVQVVYGERTGSESVREWAEREIAREIAGAGCFEGVSGYRPGEPASAALVLQVIVDDSREKTEYETSMVERDDPNRPPTERLRLVASLEVWGKVQLLTLPDGLVVRSRSLHVERGYRPVTGEDSEYEVRRLVIEAVGEEVRRWVCKGARKKLPGEIERARAAADPAR